MRLSRTHQMLWLEKILQCYKPQSSRGNDLFVVNDQGLTWKMKIKRVVEEVKKMNNNVKHFQRAMYTYPS